MDHLLIQRSLLVGMTARVIPLPAITNLIPCLDLWQFLENSAIRAVRLPLTQRSWD